MAGENSFLGDQSGLLGEAVVAPGLSIPKVPQAAEKPFIPKEDPYIPYKFGDLSGIEGDTKEASDLYQGVQDLESFVGRMHEQGIDVTRPDYRNPSSVQASQIFSNMKAKLLQKKEMLQQGLKNKQNYLKMVEEGKVQYNPDVAENYDTYFSSEKLGRSLSQAKYETQADKYLQMYQSMMAKGGATPQEYQMLMNYRDQIIGAMNNAALSEGNLSPTFVKDLTARKLPTPDFNKEQKIGSDTFGTDVTEHYKGPTTSVTESHVTGVKQFGGRGGSAKEAVRDIDNLARILSGNNYGQRMKLYGKEYEINTELQGSKTKDGKEIVGIAWDRDNAKPFFVLRNKDGDDIKLDIPQTKDGGVDIINVYRTITGDDALKDLTLDQRYRQQIQQGSVLSTKQIIHPEDISKWNKSRQDDFFVNKMYALRKAFEIPNTVNPPSDVIKTVKSSTGKMTYDWDKIENWFKEQAKQRGVSDAEFKNMEQRYNTIDTESEKAGQEKKNIYQSGVYKQDIPSDAVKTGDVSVGGVAKIDGTNKKIVKQIDPHTYQFEDGSKAMYSKKSGTWYKVL